MRLPHGSLLGTSVAVRVEVRDVVDVWVTVAVRVGVLVRVGVDVVVLVLVGVGGTQPETRVGTFRLTVSHMPSCAKALYPQQ